MINMQTISTAFILFILFSIYKEIVYQLVPSRAKLLTLILEQE